jgi:hypothetical protein
MIFIATGGYVQFNGVFNGFSVSGDREAIENPVKKIINLGA